MRLPFQIEQGAPLGGLQRYGANGFVITQASISSQPEILTWAAGNIAVDGRVTTHRLTITTDDNAEIQLPSNMVPGTRHAFFITNSAGEQAGAVTWAAGYEGAPYLTSMNEDAVASALFEVNAAGTGLDLVASAASNGLGLTLLTRSDLTNAQVLDLEDTPVGLFDGPGAGYRWQVLAWDFVLNPWVADVTNIDATAELILDVSGNQEEALEIGGGSGVLDRGEAALGSARGTLGTGNLTDVENQGITLRATNGALGDFTGGDVGNGYTVHVLVTPVPVS